MSAFVVMGATATTVAELSDFLPLPSFSWQSLGERDVASGSAVASQGAATTVSEVFDFLLLPPFSWQSLGETDVAPGQAAASEGAATASERGGDLPVHRTAASTWPVQCVLARGTWLISKQMLGDA